MTPEAGSTLKVKTVGVVPFKQRISVGKLNRTIGAGMMKLIGEQSEQHIYGNMKSATTVPLGAVNKFWLIATRFGLIANARVSEITRCKGVKLATFASVRLLSFAVTVVLLDVNSTLDDIIAWLSVCFGINVLDDCVKTDELITEEVVTTEEELMVAPLRK